LAALRSYPAWEPLGRANEAAGDKPLYRSRDFPTLNAVSRVAIRRVSVSSILAESVTRPAMRESG
jgi:hypothetical protein